MTRRGAADRIEFSPDAPAVIAVPKVRTSIEVCASRIRGHLAKSVEHVLAVGRILLDAKSAHPHGEWLRLFSDTCGNAGPLVPLSNSTATRLMTIARHPVLTNHAHVQALPSAWGTLYELSKVDHPTLRQALEDHTITPDTTRAEARSLRPLLSNANPTLRAALEGGVKTAAQPFNAVPSLRAALDRELAKWPRDQHLYFSELVTEYARHVADMCRAGTPTSD